MSPSASSGPHFSKESRSVVSGIFPSISGVTPSFLPHFNSGDINRLVMTSEGKRLPPFQRLKAKLEGVDGWLTESEGKYLYSLACHGPGRGALVEIGSWKGKSTIILATGSRAAGREKIYAIDHHKGGTDQDELGYEGVDTEAEFRQNIKAAGIEDHVIPMVMKSGEAVDRWEKPIRLLWIDGNHDYEAVKNDFLLWEPHVIKGGVIAFHDTYAWEGPRRVVEEYILPSDQFSIIGFVDSITAIRKTQQSTIFGKMKRPLLLFVRHLYILGRQHILPGEIRKWTKVCLRFMASVR